MTRARAEQNDSGAILEHLEPRLLLDGTTYLVDSLADVVAADGAVTLREAIEAANTNVIVNDAPAGSSAETDIITFAASLAGGTITLGGTELMIYEDLEIHGLGAEDLTIDANERSRVFTAYTGVTILVDGLTMSGGDSSEGGAIYGYNPSTITVTNSTISDNYSRNNGGGISSYGPITVANSTISGNTSSDNGGGIYGKSAITVTGSTIRGNESREYGGGIHGRSDITVTSSIISGNLAYDGAGGIFGIGAVVVSNSAILNNSTYEYGGGIYAGYDETFILTNSTIVGNSAVSNGGGIRTQSEGDVTLLNSVVSGNTADVDEDIYGTVSEDSSNSFIGADDGDPMLRTIINTDGEVINYIPDPGSPLIDAGDNSLAVDHEDVPLATDLRGRNRIVNAIVDIGAVELPAEPELAVSPEPVQDLLEGEQLVLSIILTAAPSGPVTVNVDMLPGGSGDLSTDVSVLEFGAGDWSVPQTVTITASHDADRDHDDAAVLAFSAAEMDTVYVQVYVTDDDHQTYVVDSLADVVADDGQLTLREAVDATRTNIAVNEAPAGDLNQTDIITFDPSLAGGTIVLGGSELTISGDLEIRGPGADKLTIDADGRSRVFRGYNLNAVIDGLTITGGWSSDDGGGIYGSGGNGELTVVNSIVSGNTALSNGGGIAGEYSLTFTVADSTISDNTADSGGGIYVASSSELTLVNSSVEGNSADLYGGGIYSYEYGEISVYNSTISGNSAGSSGGGIHGKTYGVITVTDSSVIANSGSNGGGIYGRRSPVTVLNSTVSENVATNAGGGIYTNDCSLTTMNATIVGNLAGFDGGGIYETDTAILHNTVVAENLAGSNPDIRGGASGDSSNNFIGEDGGDPMLRPVGDAAGVIVYYVPLAGSPLVDVGDNSRAVDSDGDPLVTDQRRGSRIVNGTVDIGAIEWRLAPEIVITPTLMPDMLEGQSSEFAVSLTSAPSAPVTVSIDKLPGSSGEVSADVLVLAFDADNWNVPQTVTVTAGHDADRDNDQASFALSASGMDTAYAFIPVVDDDYRIYVVDSLADVVADDGFLTLREAIHAANTNTAVNEAPAGGYGLPDVITFAGGLSGGTITLDGTQLDIADDLEIRGLGADELTIDANEESRVFSVNNGISALFGGVTITGGKETGGNQGWDRGGGGIYASAFSVITVTDSVIVDNYGYNGGGIGGRSYSTITITNSAIRDNDASAGGGLFADPSTAILVTDSTISGNTVNGHGAGIYGSDFSEITVIGSTISGNSGGDWSERTGGGIYGGKGSVIRVTDSTISDNQTKRYGGGVYGDNYSTITVTNSTFLGNYAPSGGGGIYGREYSTITVAAGSVVANNTASYGGGIGTYSRGAVTVTDSTVSGNSASGSGGGISSSNVTVTNSTIGENTSERDGGGIYGGVITVVNSTILDNSALEKGGGIRGYDSSGLRLQNTVVAGNTAPVGADVDGLLLPGSSNNFIGSNSGDPMLRAVRGSHGAVLYYVPQAGSPLIDAGDNSLAVDPQGLPLATDQRGLSRVAQAAVDIGAVEFYGLTELVMTPPVARDMVEGESLKFEVSLTSAPAGPVTVSIDKLPGSSSDISSDVLVLTFDAGNWSLPQTITITAEQDADLDSEAATFALSSPGMDTVYILALAQDDDHQTYVVNSLLDMVLVDGRVSLREAIQAANTNMPVNEAPGGSKNWTDVITFDASLAGYTIAMGGTEYVITEDLEIFGLGAGEVTIDAGGMSSVFWVERGVSALFDGLTITGGSAGYGGGIFGKEDSSITVTNSTVSDNSCWSYGGGIYSPGAITVANSTISDNSAGENGYGGGIRGNGAIMVTGSLISGNSAGRNGGGIGGYASVTVSNSTITGNFSGSDGGGIYAYSAPLVVINSTIAGNTTEDDGGGIYGSGVKMRNTVVSGNTARVQDDVYGGLSADSSNNFIGTDDGDPMLRTIVDAGGETLYYIPDTGSPLVNAGDNSLAVDPADLPLATDQRGRSRIVNAAVDIGAIERPAEAELALTPAPIQELLEGEQLVLSVSLTSAPSAPLTVNVDKHPGGSGEISADVSVLEFDAGNWNLPHAVTITAAEDADHDHDDVAAFALSAAGMDTIYVLVSVMDNDHQTYVVDSLVDLVAYDGLLTLREAIQAAGTNLRVNEAQAGDLDQTDIVTFDPSLAGETITLDGTELSITGDIEIRGLGAEKLTIDADRRSGVFHVGENVSALFDSLTITGGQWASIGGGIYGDTGSTVTVVSSTIAGNSCMTSGGGIYGYFVNVIDSTISDNLARSSGGGIMGFSQGEITVTNSTISGNTAAGSGGGFYGYGITLTGSTVTGNNAGNSGGGMVAGSNGDITVVDSTITGNTAGDNGGGIVGGSCTITVTNSTICDNSAGQDGGGIAAGEATTIVTNSTIRGNLAKRDGGGIFGNSSEVTLINSTVIDNSSDEDGGGVYATNLITLTNSTISGNSAGGDGGGIYGTRAVTSANSTVYANTTADIGGGIYAYDDITLLNTVVAGNIAATDDDIFGTLSAESSNSFIGADDGDPMLRTIIDADGAVLYHVPDTGSPLVDAGDNSLAVDPDGLPLATDVRGWTRIDNATVDIGSAERPAQAELDVAPAPVLEMTEGEQLVFTVSLTSEPLAPVTVSIDRQPGGSSDISADVSVLSFDAGNWNAPQAVTITAAQDANRDNDTVFFALSAAGMDTVHVSVSAVDDDYQTYVVDSLGDTVAADGVLTLREAILAANTNTAVNEAPGGCEGLTDIITFASSLTGQTITLDAEQLDITEDLEIRGLGADDLTIDARDLSRVFFVDEAVSVLFDGITITGGNAPDANATWWERAGGGIYAANFSAVTLNDSIVRDNHAYYGGGIFGECSSTIMVTNSTITGNSVDDAGGGIYGRDYSTITVANSTISGNDAGGGIYGRDYSTITVANSTISGNDAGGGIVGHYHCVIEVRDNSIVADNDGAGIGVSQFSEITVNNSVVSGNSGNGITAFSENWITVTDSTISGNSATYGAGIYAYIDSSVTVTNSTISGNSASAGGGGILVSQDSTLTVTNSTISENSTGTSGGGIFVSRDTALIVTNSTIRANSSGDSGGGFRAYRALPVILRNTLVAGNTTGTGAEIDATISGDSSNNFIGTSHGDPMLREVVDSDGAILYYSPQVGSPLVDAGKNSLAVDSQGIPLATDQRGRDRIANGVVDIGAVELQTSPELVLTPPVAPEMVEGESITFDVSLTSAPIEPITVNIDKLPGGSSDISADLSVLMFNAGNWTLPHTVTITAAQDADRYNDAAVFALSSPLTDTVYISAFANDDDFQTYVVDSLADVVADDGFLTLREAIEAANTNTPVNEAPAGGDGLADVITFADSLSGGTITLAGTQLAITDDLEIRGLGSEQLAVDGDGESRVFFVDTGVSVLFDNITISGANIINDEDRYGGGICGFNSSVVTVSNSTISGNVAWNGGGIFGYEGSTITVLDSSISGNVSRSGGGIYGNDIIVTNSTISDNSSDQSEGGGIMLGRSSTLVVTNSTISGNAGRGVFGYDNSTITIMDSTIARNAYYGILIRSGGAVSVTNSSISENAVHGIYGGTNTTIKVMNSTIAGNLGGASGGGIYGHRVTVTNSTIVHNSGQAGGGIDRYSNGSLTLNNTIVALNTAPSSANVRGSYTGSHNFIDGDPMLNPLIDGEGVVLYYVPIFGSPVIDAGSGTLAVDADGGPLATDQIGNPRIVGPTVDIGAIEFMSADPPTDISLSAATVAENLPAGTTVGALITEDPDPDATHTYTLVNGAGDDDNGAFLIEDDTLKTAEALDFESQSSYNIRIRSMNQGGGVIEKPFTISVTDVNDQPFVVTPITDVTVDEDAANTVLGLSGFFDDQDFGDLLAFMIVGNTNTGLVTTNLTDEQLTLVYTADQNGTTEITVRATDLSDIWIEDTFTVTVNPGNDPPFVQDPIDDVTVDEDAPDTVLDLSNIFGDIDFGDSLGLSIMGNTNTELVSADMAGEQLTLSYTENESGTAEITVRATDSGGAHIDDTFTVTVNPGNDQPLVRIPIANVVVDENSPDDVLDLSVAFDDIDPGDVLTLSVTGNSDPGLVATSVAGAELTLSYGANRHGATEITVRATDTAGAWAEDTFTATVISDGIEQPIVANPIADVTVEINAPETVLDLSDVFEETPDVLPILDYTAVEIDPVTGAPAAGTGLFAYIFTLYGNDGVDASFSTESLTFTGPIQQTKAFVTIDVSDESMTSLFEGIPGSGYIGALDTWMYDGWQPIAPGDTDITGATVILSLFTGTIAHHQQKDVIHIVAGGDVQWSGSFIRQGVSYDTSGTAGSNRLTLSIAGNTNPDLVTANILDSQLTLVYAPDVGGSAEITIRATDSAGAWVEDTFTVTVSGASSAATLPLPGDADGNNTVDDADMAVFWNTFGQRGDDLTADFNGDGRVNLTDFTIIRNNLGRTRIQPTAAPSAAPRDAVSDTVENTDDGDSALIPVAHAASEPPVDLLAMLKTPGGIEASRWNGFIELPSLRSDSCGPLPMRVDSSAPHRAATAEYDLYPPGDDPTSDDSLSDSIGTDASLDILAESPIAMLL